MKQLQVGNRYLFEIVSFVSGPHTILEMECLESTEQSYKMKNLISNYVQWIDKNQFVDSPFGLAGYCLHADLGQYSKPLTENKDKGKQLLKG